MKTKLSQRALGLVARTDPTQTCLRALLIFAAQNPGFEWGNYSGPDRQASLAAYRGDSRPVARQLREIRDLSWRFPGLDNARLREAAARAYSGRLQFREDERGVSVDYCTGQYWPTEYRKASLCVLREAIRLAGEKWDRENGKRTLASVAGGAK